LLRYARNCDHSEAFFSGLMSLPDNNDNF